MMRAYQVEGLDCCGKRAADVEQLVSSQFELFQLRQSLFIELHCVDMVVYNKRLIRASFSSFRSGKSKEYGARTIIKTKSILICFC